jgi:hypothetical protein
MAASVRACQPGERATQTVRSVPSVVVVDVTVCVDVRGDEKLTFGRAAAVSSLALLV